MIPPWLLALITLVLCSAIGVYYLNPELYTFVPEGFSVRTDQAKCEDDRTACIEAGGDNRTCTTIYNACTAKAAAANTKVSTTANAPGDSTQTTSAVSAKAYAKALGATGDLGTGDATLANEYNAKKTAVLNGTSLQSSAAYKKLLASLSERAQTEYKKPTNSQLSLAQGDDTGYSGNPNAEYKPHQEIIRAHMTPAEIKAALTAKVASDKGTQAQEIQDGAFLTPSLRDMIRNDIKKAIKDEMNEIKNEYEVSYE